MQHFSNYFVQILVIRSKVQGGTDGPEGSEKFQGGMDVGSGGQGGDVPP